MNAGSHRAQDKVQPFRKEASGGGNDRIPEPEELSEKIIGNICANDGKADRMIMATELLNQRIKDIMCMRAKQGYSDPTPTLVDIERTHILFVNAHFKPFAAIGYEYNRVRPNTGLSVFSNDVQFSIPQI